MNNLKPLAFFVALLTATTTWAEVAVNGKLPGAFTVNSDGDQVWFSQGNLRATTTDLGSNWTWSFAENQYDYIGNAAANTAINGNGTVSSNGTVDLFGWSTASSYYGINNSTNNNDYSGNFVDWGNNPITNGGNEANVWRTLTKDEWVYLFHGRTDAAKLFSLGNVNGVNGTILLPDNWSGEKFDNATDGLTDQGTYYYNSNGTNFTFHTYEGKAWDDMEKAGAVFLPAAGDRTRTNADYIGSHGFYWSTSPRGMNRAYLLIFSSSDLYPQDDNPLNNNRFCGRSVRLVSETAPVKPAATVTSPPTANILTYTGSPQELVTAGTAVGGTMNYSMNNVNWTPSMITRTNAGNYVVFYKVIGDANHTDFTPSPNTVNVTIAKAASSVSAAPAANTLTYTGSAQELVTAGTANGGTMNYSLDNISWSAAIPTATDAGDYTVYYKVIGDNNHTDFTPSPNTVNVTIAKAASSVSVAPAANVLTYTGSAQELVSAGTAVGGTMNYSLDNSSWSAAIPTATDADDYTVYYKVIGDNNHTDFTPSPNTVAVTIAKAASSVSAAPSANTLTYTGSAQELVSAGTASGGTMNYSLDNSSWSAAIPTATDAGDYTVYYKVIGDADHSDFTPSPNTVNVTIAKAASSVSAAPAANTLTYTGSAQELVTAGTAVGGTMNYSLDNSSWSAAIPTATDADDYTVYYKVIGDADHSDFIPSPNTVAVTIAKAASSVSAAPAANVLTYTGSAQELVTAGTAVGGTMNYSLDNSSWSAAIPTATDADDYTVYYKVIGDADHSDFIPSPNTVAVTIAKAASSVSVAPAAVGGLVYDGSLQTLVTAGTASGGELQYKLDDGAYSTALPQATEAGTYTVWYKVVGDANHSDLAETSFTVTIAGPDNMVLTANEDPNHAGDYYSTFYHSAVQYALPAGVEAYVATITGDALLLTRIAGAGDVLPADNAVILLAHSSSIILTPSLSAPVTFSVTNNLLGTDVPISPAPANCYVLSGHSDDDLVHAISFYRYSGTLKAHKAYAIYGGGGAGAPLRLPFVFNSATGMESLQSSAVSSQKVLRNGELIIIHGETEFNAQGQRIR